MPQVTVYVRDEDLPKWKSLPKKSEFIHQALKDQLAELVWGWHERHLKAKTRTEIDRDFETLLEELSAIRSESSPKYKELVKKTLPKPSPKINAAEGLQNIKKEINRVNPKLCEHGQVKKRCMVKTCKFYRGF